VRALVAMAIQSGDASKAGMLSVPGGAMLELRYLARAVRRRVGEITQPVLLVHPREDDRASIENSFWLQRKLAGKVDMLVLDDSYHVVTVDRQRHIVAERTIALSETVAAERAASGERIATGDAAGLSRIANRGAGHPA
jgi:carboxylesterase